MNYELVTESRRLLVSSAVTQLTTKRDQITELDRDIATAIQNKTDLETEICDALTYHSTLEECIVFLTEFVRKAAQPPVTPTISVDHITPTQESAVNERSPPPTNNTSIAHVRDVHERNIHQNYSRLPKLALSTV